MIPAATRALVSRRCARRDHAAGRRSEDAAALIKKMIGSGASGAMGSRGERLTAITWVTSPDEASA